MKEFTKRALATIGLVLMFAFPADATNCQTFQNHGGHIPGSYSFAEFYEDGALVTTVETNGQDTFVDPGQYGAGRTWDVVKKCQGTITTTTTTPTTSTTSPSTTTTIQESTSTTGGSTTTSTTQPAVTTTAPTESTTTTLVPVDNTPDSPELSELPFTGEEEGHTLEATLAFLAFSTLVVGWMLTMGSREE